MAADFFSSAAVMESMTSAVPKTSIHFALICVVMIVPLHQKNMVHGSLAGFQPQPPSCIGTCPSVSWSTKNSTGLTTFTMSSSVRNGSYNYVSFAFATDATTMGSALLVVDCYEPNGTIIMGTSKNWDHPYPMNNTDDPSRSNEVTNRMVSKYNGVLTCNFTMALPHNIAVYVFLAEGFMIPGAVPPQKNYHFVSYKSSDTYLYSGTTSAAQTSKVPVKLFVGFVSLVAAAIGNLW